MKLQDYHNKPKGYFKIETFDKNGVRKSFEQSNLIMKASREHFMKMLSGMFDTNKFINCIKLGTRGVYETEEDGKITQYDATPKDAESGFNEDLKDLFCGTSESTKGITWSGITFSPSGTTDQSLANNIQDGASNLSTVNIYIITDGEPTLTYVFDIPGEAFNGPTGYIKYNEAGLFADDTLIAMRTFKSHAKDSETSMRITWSISF